MFLHPVEETSEGYQLTIKLQRNEWKYTPKATEAAPNYADLVIGNIEHRQALEVINKEEEDYRFEQRVHPIFKPILDGFAGASHHDCDKPLLRDSRIQHTQVPSLDGIDELEALSYQVAICTYSITIPFGYPQAIARIFLDYPQHERPVDTRFFKKLKMLCYDMIYLPGENLEDAEYFRTHPSLRYIGRGVRSGTVYS